jgi:hypothetical protein
MDAASLRELATDAIRYWEPRRLAYNTTLAVIVLIYFWLNLPASRTALSLDSLLVVFLLAVMANVAYCAAYVVDVFAQASGFREQWRVHRWILFTIGVLFAGIVTRFYALGIFQHGSAARLAL